jgi:hypothetical protein
MTTQGNIDTYNTHFYRSLDEINGVKFLNKRELFQVDNSAFDLEWRKQPTVLWANIFMSMEDKTSGAKHTYVFEMTNLFCYKSQDNALKNGCSACQYLFLEQNFECY